MVSNDLKLLPLDLVTTHILIGVLVSQIHLDLFQNHYVVSS